MKLKRAYTILIGFWLFLLFACAGYQQKPSSISDNPIKSNLDISDGESLSEDKSRIVALIKTSEDYFAKGEAAYQMGHLKKAQFYFDRSIDNILTSSIDLEESGALKEKYLQFIEDIYAKEMEWLQQGDGFTETASEPALIDEIAELNLNSKNSAIESTSKAVKEGAKEIAYDIPMVMNKYVLACIELFKNERRKEIEAGLQRSGKYLPMIKQIFREEGLPQDLVYIALVESGYKPHALSRARAKGIWQFIRSTGRLYGLRVDWWVDQRCDPEKATRAAAKHLKDLYQQFGDWYLAMASYNGGANRVERAIKRLKTKDFWRIAKTRYIKRETKNYVPAILAAIMISKNPESYGFNVNNNSPLQYDKVKIKSCTDLRVIAECCQTSLKTIIELNPELRRLMTPMGYSNYEIKIPKGTKEKFLTAISSIPESKRIAWRRHLVRPGESLSVIAWRYKTSISAICQANNISNKHIIRAGRSLLIPIGPVGGEYYPVWKTTSTRYARNYKKGQKILYRVRRGDSLYKIALRYGTNVASIKKWNNITSDILLPGKKLVLWAGTVASNTNYKMTKKNGKKPIIYQVKVGDTLYDIAKEFNTTIKDICRWNGISARRKIFPGDKLTIYH
jgi:membrane-bound lytic murein transglycosylase D